MSVISSDTRWIGTILNEREIQIDGHLEGRLEETVKVIIADGAYAQADIEAQVVTLAGELVGTVNCREKLELLSTSRIKGQMITRSLMVHEGAFIDAALEMTEKPE